MQVFWLSTTNIDLRLGSIMIERLLYIEQVTSDLAVDISYWGRWKPPRVSIARLGENIHSLAREQPHQVEHRPTRPLLWHP